MRFILFQFETAAHVARTAMIMTMQAAATSSKDLGHTAIEHASRVNKWLFLLYMVFVVGAALLTYLLWQSGNTVQNAIVVDANARIEEAKQKGAEAGEKASVADKAAGEANKRAGELEKGNLVLRGQVATLETQAADATKDVAVLQKSASDAKVAQQLVQIELAKQQQKAALAEKQLAELKETLRPRNLTEEQHVALVNLLSGDPKGPVIIECVIGDGESKAFATQIAAAMTEAGWTNSGVDQVSYANGDPEGLEVAVSKADTAPIYIAHIRKAFRLVGIPIEGIADAEIAEGVVRIVVGHKARPKP